MQRYYLVSYKNKKEQEEMFEKIAESSTGLMQKEGKLYLQFDGRFVSDVEYPEVTVDQAKELLVLTKMRELLINSRALEQQIWMNIDHDFDASLDQQLQSLNDEYYDSFYYMAEHTFGSEMTDKIRSKTDFFNDEFCDALEYAILKPKMKDPLYVITNTEVQKNALLKSLQHQSFFIDHAVNSYEKAADPYGLMYRIDTQQKIVEYIPASKVLEDSSNKVMSVNRYLKQECAYQLKCDLKIGSTNLDTNGIQLHQNDLILMNRAGEVLDICQQPNIDVENESCLSIENMDGLAQSINKYCDEVNLETYLDAQEALIQQENELANDEIVI